MKNLNVNDRIGGEAVINSKGRNNLKTNIGMIYRKYGILLIFIIMFIISAMANKDFLKPQNLINIVRQNATITILACGMTMLIISGMIDLSGGASLTLAGCMAAGIMATTKSLPLAILVGLSMGAAIGWVNGLLVTKFRLQPFIATLAMMNVANGILQIYTGGSPIIGIGNMKFFGQGYIGPVPVPIIIMLLLIIVTWGVLKYTKLGLYTYAIGGNEKATVASGINVNRMKRMIFMVHGLLVGIAGIVLMGRLNSGQPSVASAGYEFDAIVAVIVGGTSFTGGIGGVVGTLIGALIVGMINNILVLMNVPTMYQLVVKGMLIAGAVILDMKTRARKV